MSARLSYVPGMTAAKSLVIVLLAAPLAAQEHVHPGAERLGHVEFPVGCSAPARLGFERAMALLHSFWWGEAERAFQGVAAADSTCAMAYWGLALTRWRNPIAGGPGAADLRAGQDAARRAAALGGRTSRERDYIAAVGALYGDTGTVPNSVRLRRYADAMEQVYSRNPRDPEAGILFAIALTASAPAGDTTFARQRRAAAILNPLFRAHPDHPGLAHYLIHANDSPQLASLGLEAARRYAEIAPSAPHAQHMPAHIFVRLGLWEETVRSNRASYGDPDTKAWRFMDEGGSPAVIMDRPVLTDAKGNTDAGSMFELENAVLDLYKQGRTRELAR